MWSREHVRDINRQEVYSRGTIGSLMTLKPLLILYIQLILDVFQNI